MVCLACCSAHASGSPGDGGLDKVAQVLLALVVILIGAKIGGEIFVRMGQPAVLGELVIGIVIGNLYLAGFNGLMAWIGHRVPGLRALCASAKKKGKGLP